MARFRIIRIMRYTETAEVEAETQEDAWEISKTIEFERNDNDIIYDEEINPITGAENDIN